MTKRLALGTPVMVNGHERGTVGGYGWWIEDYPESHRVQGYLVDIQPGDLLPHHPRVFVSMIVVHPANLRALNQTELAYPEGD